MTISQNRILGSEGKGGQNSQTSGTAKKKGLYMAALDLLENPSCMHFGISKCWSEWIENNKYSNQETKGRLNNCTPFKSIFNSNERIRNPALKSWLSKLTG